MPRLSLRVPKPAHGKGYATEAVRAAVECGDAHFESARAACIVAPENLASIRVAVKCGYREFQRTTYRGHPTVMFVREPIAYRHCRGLEKFSFPCGFA
jgi:RimJ/RimL family protein N-acetyltransferase